MNDEMKLREIQRLSITSRVTNNGALARIITPILVLITFCACATPPQRHAYSDTGSLALGKTTASECRALFGNPTETDIQTGADGKLEIFRYFQKSERWAQERGRFLIIEFKEGLLNGYVFGSSYAEDKTSFAVTNIAKIEWAASKRDDVSELLGKPQGKVLCPTGLFNGSRCKATGREIWVYANLEPNPLLTPRRVKRVFIGDICTITFDEHGFVIDISKTQSADF